ATQRVGRGALPAGDPLDAARIPLHHAVEEAHGSAVRNQARDLRAAQAHGVTSTRRCAPAGRSSTTSPRPPLANSESNGRQRAAGTPLRSASKPASPMPLTAAASGSNAISRAGSDAPGREGASPSATPNVALVSGAGPSGAGYG